MPTSRRTKVEKPERLSLKVMNAHMLDTDHILGAMLMSLARILEEHRRNYAKLEKALRNLKKRGYKHEPKRR